MAEALLVVVSKIGFILMGEATKAAIKKVSDKVTNLKELPGKMENIESELSMMNTFINQISTLNPTNDHLNGGIQKVRNLAHEVEDIIDKYSYYLLKMEEENGISKPQYAKVFSKIAEDINDMEKKIEKIAVAKSRWLQPSELGENPRVDTEIKQNQDCLIDFISDDLVGIKENKMLLIRWLYSNEQNGRVITVSGMGGVGKTTLVGNVYECEKNKFAAHAWIVVPRTCGVPEMLGKVLRKIGGPQQTQVAHMDAKDLKDAICDRLKDGKCLIVLDDVWDPEAYTQISNAFTNLRTCIFIITTRHENVAALADPTRQLKLKPLEHNDAFDLFCRKAFRKIIDCKCPQELKDLANEMVGRCQGFPLGIVSMGDMMSELPPNKNVWNDKCNQLGNVVTNNDKFLAVLKQSYDDLPGDLRNCFIYCSLFPQGYEFSREILLRIWVAERFAVQKELITPEEMADSYLRVLVQRNMLEVVEKDEMDRVSICKMHNLIHYLAQYVAKKEKFGWANDFASLEDMDSNVRRLSLCGWQENTSPNVIKDFPRLRTLVAVGITESPQLLASVFSGSKFLTSIELQYSVITELPDSIGELFNLRYIGLRHTNIISLPKSIGKLSNLRTLDIKQTKIEKIPRDIVKIRKLWHLLADRYVDAKKLEFRYFIGMQAPENLGKLVELQTLETVQASNELAEELGKLKQLRSVWIDNIRGVDCENVFAALSKMPLLSSLLLSASDENETLCFEALKPESGKLHKLIIRGCWAENTLESPIFCEHGTNLKYLALDWCNIRGDPLQLLGPHVPNLSYLRLEKVRGASTLVLSTEYFQQLKTLVLKRMNNVNQLEIRDGAFPQIEGLYVVGLPNLNTIPQGIEHLHSLTKLWLLNLHPEFRSRWVQHGMQQKLHYDLELRI